MRIPVTCQTSLKVLLALHNEIKNHLDLIGKGNPPDVAVVMRR